MQMAIEGAAGFCEEHQLGVDPRQVVECLVDHRHISDDKLGYYGVNRVQGRERHSRIGAHIAWEMLATDRGARKTVDVEACRELHRRRRVLQGRAAEVQRDMAELSSGRAPEDVCEAVARLDAMQRRLGEEHRLAAAILETDNQLSALIHDPRFRVPVPDDVEELEAVDLVALENGETRVDAMEVPERVRDYLTVSEVGEVAGVSEATARRWANGETLPHKDGDPRNPWDRDNIPVDDSLGLKRRRIHVDAIKPGFYDTEAKRQLRDELVARWPTGWSRKHAAAALPTLGH